MPTSAQLAVTRPNANDARCEALFASGLQPSDAPTAGMVAEAITGTVRRFGTGGCAGRMAQEFGDHPDAAASRMRWVRQLVRTAGPWSASALPLIERANTTKARLILPRLDYPTIIGSGQQPDHFGSALHPQRSLVAMFVFFSSRLGILGSIAVSLIVTLILLVVFRVIR
jgi:hypothetical protein